MACTSQSAVDYIQQARVHLVRELRSLSVIIENLYQQEVLSDEEVSKIQAETDDYDKTRKILDSVIKKGEQACYVLLRIIDMTRKRTLGRSSLFPEKKSEASTGTKKFDLHHWISCFSFKEDTHMDVNYLQGPRPCHRYQRKLKSKAQKISNKFWMANKNLFEERNRPDLSYTPLVLEEQGNVSPSKIKKLKSKKSKMSRPKKLRTYIPEDKPEISPSDLLKTDKDCVLVGKPGIGKTALTHEMLKLWAERDGEELDYMFYFDMRETSDLMKATSLEDLLFSVFSEPDEGKEEVLDDIKKNSDNVTIIFDGITDLSSSVVKRLVDKDLLPDAKIIITCRPDDEEDFFSRDFRRVEVKGFSERSIKTYLSVTLGEEQKKVLNNLELLTLCHVPMYALMVSVCFSSEISPQPCTTTEIYINIVRLCLKMNSNKKKTKCLNFYINNKREQILSLAEAAFNAAERKTVILTDLSCEDSCVLSFLKPLFIKVAHTETITAYSFLHYTMQEFFAALWLLKNPDKVQDVFQQSLTEEMKHMRHLIPFMCRLLNEKNPSLMTCLIPAEELRSTSDGFFKELINKDRGSDVDILFLCQCLYESQCPEACSDLLNTLDYSLDLSEQSLDPYSCCAVAYVVSQSKERKIHLDLENVVISEQGMRRLIGCLQCVQWCDPLPRQLWKIFLLSEEQMDHSSLLGVDGNQLHLPVEGKKQLFEGAVKVMQKVTTKVNVCLYWDRPTPVCQHLCESLFEGLLHISSLSFRVTHRDPGSEDQERHHETLRREEKRLLLELCLKAALHKEESFHSVVNRLFSLFSVNTDLINILLDFYHHVKSEGCSSVIPKLRSVFQSAPSVWIIDLSERKTSILLEVLKLQPEKKRVELTGWSDEESEVRSLLQCLPYISQLSFVPQSSDPSDGPRFFGNLLCAAAEREQQTGEKILELLSSVCTYQTFLLKQKWCDFLLDVCSHVKDYETKTGLRVLPSLQSVFRSASSVWIIDLSERKTSILLEVLKLQPEKKQVELTGWSDEESEVRSLLQCLPYISQLSFVPQSSDPSDGPRFFGNLLCAAAEREQQTGEKILEMLSSVCTYQTFPFNDRDMDDYDPQYQCDFLLDVCSHVKDYETKTGLRVLPSLQSVFQSAPSVWIIDLSERKTSILLEVLKLQPEKKRVELTGWSDEESEVRSLLQCLPYISQLSFSPLFKVSNQTRLFGNLLCAAAEREQQTGEKILELLSSVCTYQTFPLNNRYMDDDDPQYQCDFLLDLFSHVKDYETKTGLRVLPVFQSVFQSAPSVWIIDLSERKTSILLEVLKLQPEKKRVELRGWSDEESEVRSLLQCLPYISQLSCDPDFFQRVCTSISVKSRQEVQQLVSLLKLLDFTLQLTGELNRKTCRTVGRVLGLCSSNVDLILTPRKVSVRGASLLFRPSTQLHSLRLSSHMVLLLFHWVRRGRLFCPLAVDELSLAPDRAQLSDRELLKVVSGLASLLRYCAVRRLDLTESCFPAQCLITLLLHHGSLTIRLSEESFQQLLTLLHEIQDQDLTLFFLSKVGGDLNCCCVNWELLHYLLQQPSAQTITVNLRKNHFLQENVTRLLPFLDRILLKRSSPSFVLAAIREIYKAQTSQIIPSLQRSLGHVINLTCRELDSEDCAALLFTLRHSDRVKLNLTWTSIPTEETQSILCSLDRVSQLSVDRNLLLRFIHCCAASDVLQEAASDLFRTLQHRLDLSCSSCVQLEDQTQTLGLTGDDCRAVSTVLRHSTQLSQLDLRDCEVEDSGLDLLFPVLHRVHLRASKAVLLQLLSLVPVNPEGDSVRRAESLCAALGGELDLSHTTLDQRACGALALMLDFSEGLEELDLSHCQLTDQLLLTLITHLHKVHVLDLSHNKITDVSTDKLLQLVCINPSTVTVRLFGNNIVDRTTFKKHTQFEIW
ncbi:uncharacterized protein LOC108873155 isoform X8 [Lates calcarifer]|uniref:Uncharacterized protein LOC108873155 isoform X6 n=1 Tax=Lates calcarifer TaxID=8187 RepID=A0AAJ8AW89_LATCA|nr:uncharacterized protein LOC108873155 isoform X6 [Lates calcarifer]XP_050921859.1 uncharacterized protein LOC108873155 isoform X8 [Lates calcarifer]